ncbi:MAG: hypothetical protein GF368_00485 [Candidatus Aenigmarchaeota archaeon]|nr:hypothetical protein [Candidatus Aenigmarchaeota archaeon]
METGLIGAVLIGLVVLVVSVLIIKSLGYEIQLNIKEGIKEFFGEIYSQIFGRDYYNICEVYDNDYISFNDFKTLLNAVYNKKCGNSKINVIISFSLREEDIKKLAEELDIAKNGELIYQGSSDETLGMGAIIVDTEHTGNFLFEFRDEITLWNEGEPNEDTLISLTGLDCDIYDKTCTPTTGYIPPTFTLLYIQLEGNVPDFETKAEGAKDFWVQKTSLSSCPDRVNFIAENTQICDVPDQIDICGASAAIAEATVSQTMNSISNCINNWGYTDDYTRVVGIIPGDYVCSGSLGSVNGYAYINGEYVVSAEGDFTSLHYLSSTSTHELGHTFGLCDEGYGNCIDNGCSSGFREGECTSMGCIDTTTHCCPNEPELDSIMCTFDDCNRGCDYDHRFADTSRTYLESQLNSYCN